jgi:hypothetical protein
MPGGGGQRIAGGGSGQRVGGGAGQRVGGRPTAGDLQNFLDLPSPGGRGGAGRPGGGSMAGAVAGGAMAGGAAAAFLHDRPEGGFDSGERGGGPGGRGPEIAQLPGRGGDGVRRGGDLVRPGGGGEGVRRGGDGDRGLRPGEGGRGERRGDGDRGTRPGGGGEGIRRGGDGDRGLRPGQGGRGEQIRPGGGNNFVNNRPVQINNRNEWNQWRQNNGNFVRDNWRQHWRDHDGWFNNDWWDHHHHDHWPFNGNTNWWAWAAWPAVTAWFPWGWSQPVYYNYGYPDSIYYVDNTVYQAGQPIASAEDYAYQAEQIATSIPQNVTPAADDWLPLGVFALTQDGQPSGVEPTIYLQLTVSKQGIIAGTIQNTATGKVQSIEGMVDKDSQRAAWTVVGKTRPLMETGISNLTQDTAPALIHFEDGTTQQWLMVRLDKPAPPAQ